MNRRINHLLAGCLALLLAPAYAQGPGKSVLGIELGARLLLPKCGAGGGTVTSQPCLSSDPVDRKAWGAEEHHVAVPVSAAPSYSRGDIRVVTVGGVVESVRIATWGIQSQDGALASLTGEYGKPTRIRRQKQAYSRTPAQFAEWDFAELSVRLHGSTGSIDWGLVEVSTNRYRKLVKDYEEGRAAK
jgi:hypothetical protein